MHIDESRRVLRDSYLFRDLNEIHLELILMICEEIAYDAGDVIFRQDEPGDALYIVGRGEVEVFLETEGEELELALLGEKETFGESILVEEGGRSAGIRCRTPVQLLRLPRRQIVRLMANYPEIGYRILHRMAADLMLKLQSANRRLRRAYKETESR
ncbi:MAG: cyclic nucleotide-binding domain-containing protein [Anaerolineales bacterium]